MQIDQLFSEKNIHPDMESRSKLKAIQEIATFICARHQSLDEQKVVQVLLEREKLSSTAVGGGVAIPHAKYPGIDNLIAAYTRSSEGIEFDAVDGQPVRHFFVLLVPEEAVGSHLNALASISKFCKAPSFLESMAGTQTAKEIHDTISASL